MHLAPRRRKYSKGGKKSSHFSPFTTYKGTSEYLGTGPGSERKSLSIRSSRQRTNVLGKFTEQFNFAKHGRQKKIIYLQRRKYFSSEERGLRQQNRRTIQI